MITISIVSGEILELFDEVREPLTGREIEAYLGESREDILMSLGWLVKEGLLTMECLGGSTFFICKKKESKRQLMKTH